MRNERVCENDEYDDSENFDWYENWREMINVDISESYDQSRSFTRITINSKISRITINMRTSIIMVSHEKGLELRSSRELRSV
jgi:hypothetical protein